MDLLRQLVQKGDALLNLRVVLLTGVVSAMGAVLVMVRRSHSSREGKKKILRAQKRREHSLQEAEKAVLQYKQSHPIIDTTFILSLTLTELTKQIQDGSLSPEEVLYAYMEKTLDVHQKLNCSTEIILESFEQLKTISSSKKGILYGVPVSLKENVLLKSYDSSCGLAKYLDNPSEDDCVLVKVLKKQGAIPFVRTNLPQALLNYECSNPIYGKTVNPHNVQKTSGGSSGGEASLIGGGGSLIGIGTDIGGSIRIPSSFCGICGFKPTSGRLSSKGMRPCHRGQKTVMSSAGPMAMNVESLALFMKAVLCDDLFSLDPTVPPLPFNEEVYQSRKPLRIGFFEKIEEVPPSPSMMRAVKEVKALLEQAGHTLVPYKPVRIMEITEHMTKGVVADGGFTFLQQMKGIAVDPVLKFQVTSYRLPNWLKKAISFILKPVSPRFAFLMNCISGVGSVPELWKLQAGIEDCVNDTIAEWRRLDIDVLLCPIIGPAFNFNYCGKLNCLLPYSMTYNVLNFCAGVVPVSSVTAEDERTLSYLESGDIFDQTLRKAATGGVGLPVCVQCVALPWQEELCLRFMKEVEELVKQKRN